VSDAASDATSSDSSRPPLPADDDSEAQGDDMGVGGMMTLHVGEGGVSSPTGVPAAAAAAACVAVGLWALECGIGGSSAAALQGSNSRVSLQLCVCVMQHFWEMEPGGMASARWGRLRVAWRGGGESSDGGSDVCRGCKLLLIA